MSRKRGFWFLRNPKPESMNCGTGGFRESRYSISLGEWDFYALTFLITRDTLIPRMDTEKLAECGIEWMKSREKGRILDLCCGTGCVGISILHHLDDGIIGVFADISDPALKVNSTEHHAA